MKSIKSDKFWKNLQEERFWYESVDLLVRSNWNLTRSHAIKILNLEDSSISMLNSILLCASFRGFQVLD